jgi:hypothetical protein
MTIVIVNKYTCTGGDNGRTTPLTRHPKLVKQIQSLTKTNTEPHKNLDRSMDLIRRLKVDNDCAWRVSAGNKFHASIHL